MFIKISNSSGQPIYDQISAQIKVKILSGELKEKDMLPSMRSLAKELNVSVITTKRAYEELERDGFIKSVTGKGSFVSKINYNYVRVEYIRRIYEHMLNIVGLSAACNIELDKLINMLSSTYKNNGKAEERMSQTENF
ncbi:MAG: GntR family transcriptional regulator [Oscillospiraceae bacterium]